MPPAVGTLLGGLLARRLELSAQSLSFVLHLAAGMVFGVVGVELMPRALEATPTVVLVTFFAGGLTYVGVTLAAQRVGQSLDGEGIAAVIVGVGFDLFTDGLMIAAATGVSTGLGLLIALSLLAADAPEAFSAIASLRHRGIAPRKTLVIAVVLALLVLAGGPIGYLALRGQPEVVELGVLSFNAGLLVLVVVEGLIPEAHDLSRLQSEEAGLLFLAGFTAFAFLSLYVGA